MAETNPTPAPAETNPAPAPAPADNGAAATPPVDSTDYKALYEALKSDARKWEARSKENAEKAKAYDELQAKANAQAQANKTLEEQVADIRNQLNASTLANARLKVASEKGVPADLIFGSTEEEMRDAADAILKFREDTAPKVAAPVIPNEGKTPGGGAMPSDYEQMVHDFFGGN